MSSSSVSVSINNESNNNSLISNKVSSVIILDADPNENSDNNNNQTNCEFTPDELSRKLEDSEFGNNEEMFNRYFVANQMPVRCKKCNRLIVSHEEETPNASSAAADQNESSTRSEKSYTPITKVSVTRRPQIDSSGRSQGNNNDDHHQDNKHKEMDSFFEHSGSSTKGALSNVKQNTNTNTDHLRHLIRNSYSDEEIVNKPDQFTKYYRLPYFVVCSIVVVIACLTATLFIVFKLMDFTSPEKSMFERWIAGVGPLCLLIIGFILSFLPEKVYVTFDRRAKEICYIRYRLLWWCLSRTAVAKFRHIVSVETRESSKTKSGEKMEVVYIQTSKIRSNPLLAVSMVNQHSSSSHGHFEQHTTTPSRRRQSVSFRNFSSEHDNDDDEDSVEDREFVLDEVPEEESEDCRESWIFYLRSIGVQL